MRKIIKFCMLCVTTLLFTLFLFENNVINVAAENVLEVSEENYESYLDQTISTDTFYQDFDIIIEEYFPNFNIEPTQYETTVLGKNNFRILEITPRSYIGDSTIQVSDISNNVNNIKSIYEHSISKNNVMDKNFITNIPNYNVDVMTIKQFVDNRENLKGRYDAIIFAGGDYNPSQVQSCDPYFEDCSSVLNTQNILNDITFLKADEIIEDYVLLGLPVFLHQDIFNYSNSNLFHSFNSLETQYSNVFTLDYVVSNTSANMSFYNTLAIMGITELLSTKPNVEMITTPIDYNEDSTKTYNIGEQINFEFKLTNKDSANLLFYLDVDQNEIFEEEELAFTKMVYKNDNSFSFNLPQVFPGLLKYKLVFDKDGLISTNEGTLRVRGERKEIKVLNIVSDMVYYKNSLFDENLFRNYFSNNEDYEITIESCKIKDFKKNNPKFYCSHNRIMDEFDVIFIGQDVFDQSINKHVYNSIQEQINLGKPIIFSSSVTKGNANWMNYFSDDLTFSDYETDLHKLSYNVDKLQVVNNSSFVTYPFNMNYENLNVPEDLNYAFNEQYQLDLNNQQLVPLLNMYNSDEYRIDRFDSYNNFYYYKNDNIVYLNVGNNSFQNYTDIEHKLLANAMINLYINAYTTPIELDEQFYLNVNNQYENSLIDIKDNINFDFDVYSNNPKQFAYQVIVNEIIINEGNITTSEQLNVNIDNLDELVTVNSDNATKLLIQVKVINDSDEVKVYQFYVFVANIQNYVNIVRSITPLIDDKYIEINKEYSIDYTINFNTLEFDYINYENLPKTIILSNIVFEDLIPTGITITNPNEMYEVSENGLNQTIIRKDLNDVILTLNNEGNYTPNVQKIELQIPFTTSDLNIYDFNNGYLSLDGISTDSESKLFNNITIESLKGINDSMVNFKFIDYLFVPFDSINVDLINQTVISNETHVSQIIFNPLDNLDDSSVNHFNLITDDDGKFYLEPQSIGDQRIEIVVTDIFGNTVRKEFVAYTYKWVNSITVDESHSINVDETKSLNIQLDPADIELENLRFEIINHNSTDEKVINLDEETGQITGLIPGSADIIITGYDHLGNTITKVISVIVNASNSLEFENNYLQLITGDADIEAPTVLFNNEPYTLNNLTWVSSNEDVATVVDGIITAKEPGSATITATLPDGSASALMLVKVYDKLSTESGFDIVKLGNVNIYEKTNYNLYDFIKLTPDNIDLSAVEITFNVIGPVDIFEFDPENNTLKTLGPGDVTIDVLIIQNDKDNEEIARAEDSFALHILPTPDPIVDSGDNKN